MGSDPVSAPTPDPASVTVLENGVRIIVRELRTAPVVALNLWVGTGGADDPPDRPGVSHFIEHMIFKPDGAGGGDLARTVYEAGGSTNASTSSDHTVYYQIMPANAWTQALSAQARAVRSPSFGKAAVETERHVILEELRSAEADPDRVVHRLLVETSLLKHPARRPILGTEPSITAVRSDELAAHHDAHYRGENMVIVIVGDVDAGEATERAAEAFGGQGAGDRPPRVRATEPVQEKLRARCAHAPVREVSVAVAFHAPGVLDGDIPALDALCGLLGRGRSSRLYRRLVLDEGVVSELSCGISAYRDMGLVSLRASATTHGIERIVRAVFEEAWAIAGTPPSGAEMERNLRRLEAGYLLEHETPEAMAGGLGYFALLGDHRLAETYVDRLADVTPGDMSRVAGEYLLPSRAAVLLFGPDDMACPEGDVSAFVAGSIGPAGGRETVRESRAGWRRGGFDRPMILSEARAPRRERQTLSCGATLITSHTEWLPLTSVALGLKGGHSQETDTLSGATYLMMRAALKGTRQRRGGALADEIESMGTTFSTLVERDGFGIGSTCLARLQSGAAPLLGEVLIEPALEIADVDVARTEVENEIGQLEDRPATRALLPLLPLLFPEHPYGRPLRGTRESLGRLTREDLLSNHRANQDPRNLVVCASGSVDAGALREAVERLAERLKSDRPAGGRAASVPVRVRPERVERSNRVSGQSYLAVGFRGPSAGDRDALAMRFLARALSMMGGPLWMALREGPPHAYSAHASPLLLASGGAVLFSVTARPGDEKRAEERLLEVLARLREDGLVPETLDRSRRSVAGMMEIAMQRESTRAASYAISEILGVGFERLESAPDDVRRLVNDDVIRIAREYLDPEAGYALVTLNG